MSPRRVGILLGRDLGRGPRNFFFIFAILVPLVISAIVSLVFGTLFSEKPKLGITDEGRSRFGQLASEVDSLVIREFVSATELREAVSEGVVDFGMVLPTGFDDDVIAGETAELYAYIWGESLLKNRAILGATVAFLVREIAGQDSPIEIVTTTLGDAENIPWEDRLLPFIVLMAVVIGGVMVPATALVDEKQKRTLTALTVTPTSLGDVLAAKGAMGALLSLAMGLLTLVLNRAFGGQPALIIAILALGAVLAAAFGVLLGLLVKDINTLFATIKAIGILLYAPAIIYLFPNIPQWIGRIFPTYYLLNPVIEISQYGAKWSDVASEVLVLCGLIVVLIGVVSVVARRSAVNVST